MSRLSHICRATLQKTYLLLQRFLLLHLPMKLMRYGLFQIYQRLAKITSLLYLHISLVLITNLLLSMSHQVWVPVLFMLSLQALILVYYR